MASAGLMRSMDFSVLAYVAPPRQRERQNVPESEPDVVQHYFMTEGL